MLTDHKEFIQCLSCTCGWKNRYTVSGIYGNATHPELLYLQVILGSKQSFYKVASILNVLCAEKRSENSDVILMRNVKNGDKN